MSEKAKKKMKMWQVVSPSPKMVKVINKDGTTEDKMMSSEHPPFQPVVDRRFTILRQRGHIQPVRVEVDPDEPGEIKVVNDRKKPKKEKAVEPSDPVVVTPEADEVEASEGLTSDLDIPDRLKGLLQDAGLTTIEELKAVSDEDLAGVEGLGAKSIERIRKAVNKH